MNIIIDQHILDDLTARAKASPRLYLNLDLWNSLMDKFHRMFYAIELGTVMPIHRNKGSSETVVCIRGRFKI